MAVLSAAGILAGGGGWVAVNGTGSGPAPTGAGPGDVAPDDAARWAGQAQVVLASVTQQLDIVAQAQEAWNKLPESRIAGALPAPVAQILERKALLEQQRATLESQLGAWRSLDKVNGELASADQQLGTVQKALDSLPQGEQRTSEQAATVKQLAEQRDVRVRQRDAKQQELDSLKTGVHNAVVTPLQDTAGKTKALADTVLGLVNGQAPTKPNGPEHEPTPGVANRDNQNRQRQDIDNSAPLTPGPAQAGASPHPGGVDGAAGAVGGAVDGVTGAAGSLLSNGAEARGGTNGTQPSSPAPSQDQTRAKADKGPAAERQAKDGRGTTPRAGRLGGTAADVLQSAGYLPHGAGVPAAGPSGGTTSDPQSGAPVPRSAGTTVPATTAPAVVQNIDRPAAVGMARGVMPQFTPGAASMLDGGAMTSAPTAGAAMVSSPMAGAAMASAAMASAPMASGPTQQDSSANPAPPQGSRKVTVDQLVDYAWQRAIDEAQRRQAESASQPARAATTTPPSSQEPAADQVPAQYQEMVSAWSSGR